MSKKTTTPAPIRATDLFDELLPEGYSHQAIHAGLKTVVGDLLPPEEEGGAAISTALELPQDGAGWLLTAVEAGRVRSAVRANEPTCLTCGQPAKLD